MLSSFSWAQLHEPILSWTFSSCTWLWTVGAIMCLGASLVCHLLCWIYCSLWSCFSGWLGQTSAIHLFSLTWRVLALSLSSERTCYWLPCLTHSASITRSTSQGGHWSSASWWASYLSSLKTSPSSPSTSCSSWSSSVTPRRSSRLRLCFLLEWSARALPSWFHSLTWSCALRTSLIQLFSKKSWLCVERKSLRKIKKLQIKSSRSQEQVSCAETPPLPQALNNKLRKAA